MTPLLEPIPSTIALCTRDQVKERVGIERGGDDDRIDSIIAGLLPTFQRRFRREFMPHITELRSFDVDHSVVSLGVSDLRTASSVVLTLDGVDTELAEGHDYVLWPLDPLTGTAGYLRLSSRLCLESTHLDNFGFVPLTITGDWGIWASVDEVPEDVNLAAINTALSWLDRSTAEISGLAGGDPRYLEPGVVQTRDIPYAEWLKLAPYNRPEPVV